MNQNNQPESGIQLHDEAQEFHALSEKLLDALIPGFCVECDPEEAVTAGAFIEDALTEIDAQDSCFDDLERFKAFDTANHEITRCE